LNDMRLREDLQSVAGSPENHTTDSYAPNGVAEERNRAVVYCRASARNNALEAVREEGEAYALTHGFTVIEIVEDIGSRPLFKRRGVKRLLQLAQEGQIDTVISECLFTFLRFGLQEDYVELFRWLEDYRQLRNKLLEHKVSIVLVTPNPGVIDEWLNCPPEQADT
jgi:DNA invertase Pin-like site-specific DNA recombinase